MADFFSPSFKSFKLLNFYKFSEASDEQIKLEASLRNLFQLFILIWIFI